MKPPQEFESRSAEAVYEVVRTIPAGRVVTYGQVAQLVEGISVGPRQVGGIMSVCPSNVPWHRVLGAGGRLSIARRSAELGILQRQLLTSEGVGFLSNGCVDMHRHQWLAEEVLNTGLFGVEE
jgi:methylated-DNA-protein-cysteine methyltransferase-like protein